MSQYNWKEYSQIRRDFDLNEMKSSFDSLRSLLNGISLANDYKLLKSVSKRITIRLRTAKVSRLIKQTKKCFDELFELKIYEIMDQNMSSLVNENYDISSGCLLLPFRQQIDSVLKVFLRSAPILRKIVLVSMNAFSHCYQWLRSGNLAPHFLMMSSCLSRLNFISKAIVVYVNDLYSPLIAIKDILKEKQSIYKEKTSFPNSLQDFLIDLNIKCETITTKTKNQIRNSNEGIGEDIGVPIQRNELQSKKKKKNENKSKFKAKKNKNKLNIKPKQMIETKSQKQIQMRKKKRKN